jgi:hypothetical protein
LAKVILDEDGIEPAISGLRQVTYLRYETATQVLAQLLSRQGLHTEAVEMPRAYGSDDEATNLQLADVLEVQVASQRPYGLYGLL